MVYTVTHETILQGNLFTRKLLKRNFICIQNVIYIYNLQIIFQIKSQIKILKFHIDFIPLKDSICKQNVI